MASRSASSSPAALSSSQSPSISASRSRGSASALEPVEQRRVADHQLAEVLAGAEELHEHLGGSGMLGQDPEHGLGPPVGRDEPLEVRQRHAGVGAAGQEQVQLAGDPARSVRPPRPAREVARGRGRRARCRGRPVRRASAGSARDRRRAARTTRRSSARCQACREPLGRWSRIDAPRIDDIGFDFTSRRSRARRAGDGEGSSRRRPG